MKKKIMVLTLAICLIFLSGCGASDALKLTQTSLSSSYFYYEAIKENYDIINEGATELYLDHGNDQTYKSFNSSLASAVYGHDVITSIVGVMDFASFIAESESAVTETDRIYEYDLTGNGSGYIVVAINKVKNKQVYNCKTYILDAMPSGFDQIFNNDPSSINSYTVTLDKDTGVYEFSDSNNGINGTFYYNKYSGKLAILLNVTIYNEETAVGMYSINLNFYNFKNALGGRILTSYSGGDNTQKCINEFYAKDFYKKVKFGLVKDESLYDNMEKTTQEKIAAKNAGDDNGFTIVYNAMGDTVQVRVDSY